MNTAIRTILVVGCNPLGLQIAHQLTSRGEPVLLVDHDEAAVQAAREQGHDALQADYTDDDQLRALGIGESLRLLFAVLGEDVTNVFLAISARALDPALRIVALAQSGDSARRLLAAGANKIIDPHEISSRKIYEMVRRPLVAEILEQTVFGKQNLDVAEVEVPAGSFLDGIPLQQVQKKLLYNLLVLGMVDRTQSDAFVFATGNMERMVDAGDVLVVIGPVEAIALFKSELPARHDLDTKDSLPG